MTEQRPHPNLHSHDTPYGLGLQIPQLSPPPADSFLTDPKRTGEWIEALPVANIGETARRVYKALVDLNRMQLPEKVRLRNAERLRQPVEFIDHNLVKHYMDKGFPLAEKNQKVTVLARELHTELAIAYKIVIEQLLSGKSKRFDREMLSIAMNRVLYHLAQVLYECALVYSPPPPGAWREANAIFAYALQNGVHDQAIKDTRDDDAGITLSHLYRGIVLFAAASPSRLRQNQIQQLYARIPDWSQSVRLLEKSDEIIGNSLFSVDLGADKPPLHQSLVRDRSDSRLIFDVGPLLVRLREEFEKLPWEGDSDFSLHKDSLPRSLLRQLMIGWSTAPVRKFVRTRLNFELHVAVGTGTVHNLITGSIDRPRKVEPLIDIESGGHSVVDWDKELWGDSGSFSLAPLDSPLDMHGTTKDNIGAADAPPADIFGRPAAPPEKDASQEVVHVQTNNESAGGYCICWTRNADPKVRVGELIGIQSASNPRQYGICVVRWLKHDPGQPLEMGLQILAPRCTAGEVALVEGGALTPPADRSKCLVLMDNTDSAHDTETVIVQSTKFQEGNTLWLVINEAARKIRLRRQVEMSSTFVQYEFEPVAEQTPSSGNTDPFDFDDIWPTL